MSSSILSFSATETPAACPTPVNSVVGLCRNMAENRTTSSAVTSRFPDSICVTAERDSPTCLPTSDWLMPDPIRSWRSRRLSSFMCDDPWKQLLHMRPII